MRKRFGRTQALDGVDLAMRHGTVLGVLGPNGAGKRTAVRVLATLLCPDSGSAQVAGIDVLRQPERVRRRIGPGGMRRRLDLAASLVGRPEVIVLDEPTTGLDPAKREDMWGVVRTQVTEGSSVLLTTQYLEEADALADEIVVVDAGRVIAHDTPEGLKRRVGGQTLRVRPNDPARLADVLHLLDAVAAPGTSVSRDTTAGSRPGAASVPVTGDAALTAVVGGLVSAGLEGSELALHLPSLDEVFRRLTDASVRTEATPPRATPRTRRSSCDRHRHRCPRHRPAPRRPRPPARRSAVRAGAAQCSVGPTQLIKTVRTPEALIDVTSQPVIFLLALHVPVRRRDKRR